MNPSLHSYVIVNFEQLKIISKNAKLSIYQHGENGHELNLWRVSKNALVAPNLYPQRYPGRRHPTDKIFNRLEMKLRNDWPVSKRGTHLANEIRVLETALENPHIGQWVIAREIAISQFSVCHMLKANNFHPYHMLLVHELRETDFPFFHFAILLGNNC
mgnify:CR=1 FL=1